MEEVRVKLPESPFAKEEIYLECGNLRSRSTGWDVKRLPEIGYKTAPCFTPWKEREVAASSEPAREMAKRYGVSPSTIYRIRKHYRERTA